MAHSRKTNIEHKNLRFSAKNPQNLTDITQRMGPPYLNASESHAIATWLQRQFAADGQNFRGLFNEGENEEENRHRISRLERFLRAETQATPCYSPKFKNYNDHLWSVRSTRRPSSCPPMAHISYNTEALHEIRREGPEDDQLTDFELVQSRRRQREANLSNDIKTQRRRLIEK